MEQCQEHEIKKLKEALTWALERAESNAVQTVDNWSNFAEYVAEANNELDQILVYRKEFNL